MRRAIGLIVLLVAARAAAAPDARDLAKQHYAAGEKRWKAGDFRGAIVEFTAADELSPSPVLSYNIALCHDRLGDKGPAAQRYQEYLARWPEAPNRAEVEARIAALGAPAPAEAAPLPAPAPPPAKAKGKRKAVAAPVAPAPAPPDDSLETPPAMREQPQTGYDGAFANRIPGPADAVRGTETTPEPGPGPLAPSAPAPAPESRPFYAQWWFWVILGVGVAITVDIAVSSSNSNSAPATGFTVVQF